MIWSHWVSPETLHVPNIVEYARYPCQMLGPHAGRQQARVRSLRRFPEDLWNQKAAQLSTPLALDPFHIPLASIAPSAGQPIDDKLLTHARQSNLPKVSQNLPILPSLPISSSSTSRGQPCLRGQPQGKCSLKNRSGQGPLCSMAWIVMWPHKSAGHPVRSAESPIRFEGLRGVFAGVAWTGQSRCSKWGQRKLGSKRNSCAVSLPS